MQDDQSGQKTMVLTSAEETRLTCFLYYDKKNFCSKQPSLTVDVNTIAFVSKENRPFFISTFSF
jgi:hypothetical protein